VGVVEFVLGGFFGSLRAPVRNGNLARCAACIATK
jgi:hypothetical protein